MNLRVCTLLVVAFVSALCFTSVAFAQTPPPYIPLAPLPGLGGPFDLTTTWALSSFLVGIFKLAIGLAGVLAVVMLVICGIKLMGTPSASARSEAKECIWNAIFGLLLAIGSWAILYTINPQLIATDLNSAVNSVASMPAPVVTAPPVGTGGKTYEWQAGPSCTPKPGMISATVGNSFCTGTPPSASSICCASADSPLPPPVPTKPSVPPEPTSTPPTTTPTPTTGANCAHVNVPSGNLCSPLKRVCTSGTCAQFAPYAAKYASGVVTADFIKAIIVQESSCGRATLGPATQYGQACGPMQMLVSTANTMRSACGVTDSVTCEWLRDPQNLDKQICLGAAYLKSLAAGKCGSDGIRTIAAGYNSGPVRCQDSVSCKGETSCGGGPTRQWECLYNDPQHNVCNSGLKETRFYATQVLYCSQNPGF